MAKPKSSSPTKIEPLHTGDVFAFIVGIEDYQTRRGAQIQSVDFARADAQSFADVLRRIFPRVQITLQVDSDATRTNIDDALKREITALGEDDLFIFYYAGHGFHGVGGNRITAWDTNAHHLDTTTLLLREVLLDRLTRSRCRRALAFVDACATSLEPLHGRDILTELNPNEMQDFLAAAHYSALYLSCSPGERSYPSPRLRHGIWTHFLIQALGGDADTALGPGRFLTDAGLRDYLAREVPRFVTRELNIREQQTPQAIVSASNTFAILEVPIPKSTLVDQRDFRRVKITPSREFLEGVTEARINTLPEFRRGNFYEPSYSSEATRRQTEKWLGPLVDEEIQRLYESVRSKLGLKRRDVIRESADGQGSLDTPLFRFSIESGQAAGAPNKYQITRQLELREGYEGSIEHIDDIFGINFDRIVVAVEGRDLIFDELADFFEDFAGLNGGDFIDDEPNGLLTYTTPDQTVIMIDTLHGRVTLAGQRRTGAQALLDRSHKYRFGISGPSRLLLGR